MRRKPPAGVVAAAEQEYHGMRDKLDQLLPAVRRLLAREGFCEVEGAYPRILDTGFMRPGPA